MVARTFIFVASVLVVACGEVAGPRTDGDTTTSPSHGDHADGDEFGFGDSLTPAGDGGDQVDPAGDDEQAPGDDAHAPSGDQAGGDAEQGSGDDPNQEGDSNVAQGDTAVSMGDTVGPVCQDGWFRYSTVSCGINDRGTYLEECVGQQWSLTTTCNDPDDCLDDAVRLGALQCGINGRGYYQQVCVTGHWQETTTCIDPDLCLDGALQPGETACGLNDRGDFQQACVDGRWQDTSVCLDPDACVDSSTRPGSTVCGLNDRGVFQQLCVSGQWQETSTCIDPDECVDDALRPGVNPCGLNGRGVYQQRCVIGQWQYTSTCLDPDECVDDSARAGFTPCGMNLRGTYEQLCLTGHWQETSNCLDPDECTDLDIRAGTTICGIFLRGALEQECTLGQWEDTVNCVDPSQITLLKDINTILDVNGCTGYSTPQDFTAFGDLILFSADDGVHGLEPWVSDGTASGTILLKDIYAGTLGSETKDFTVASSSVFFAADRELWETEGTPASTVQIGISVTRTYADNLYFANGALYLSANSGAIGQEPYRYILYNRKSWDLNPSGDSMPANFIKIGTRLYFSAQGSTTQGRELWAVNLTTEVASLIKDINPTSGASGISAYSPELTELGGLLFFVADDGVNGEELWTSNGSTSGTYMLRDINPTGSSNPGRLISYNNKLYFTANDGVHGWELWVSDGTPVGTTLLLDINPSGNSTPDWYTVYRGLLYFSAIDSRGRELWRTDGTSSGTEMVLDIFTSGSSGVRGFYFGKENDKNAFYVFNDFLIFITTYSSVDRLWRSDGTSAGTIPLHEFTELWGEIGSAGGNLFFTADDYYHHREPWIAVP